MNKRSTKVGLLKVAAGAAAVLLAANLAYAGLQQFTLNSIAPSQAAQAEARAAEAGTAESPAVSGIERVLYFTTIVAKEAKQELLTNGVDPYKQQSQADLDDMVRQMAPYIARELGVEKLNLPPIRIKNHGSSNYNLSLNIHPHERNYISEQNRIELSAFNIVDAKKVLTHEEIHAQVLTRPLYAVILDLVTSRLLQMDILAGPANETYTELVTSEVLANQALDGDKLAKYAFFVYTQGAFSTALKGEMNEGQLTSDERAYNQKPAMKLLELLNGGPDTYRGVRLDGSAKLMKQEMARLGYSPESLVTSSDVQRYCKSPDSRVVCAGPIVSISAKNPHDSGNLVVIVDYQLNDHMIQFAGGRYGAGKYELDPVDAKAFKQLGVTELPLLLAVGGMQGRQSATIQLLDANGRELLVQIPSERHIDRAFYVLKNGELLEAGQPTADHMLNTGKSFSAVVGRAGS